MPAISLRVREQAPMPPPPSAPARSRRQRRLLNLPNAPPAVCRGRLPGPAARRPSPADRDILWLYLLTRIAIWITAYCARLLFPSTAPPAPPPRPLAL